MTPLGALWILFWVMAIIGLVGIIALFVTGGRPVSKKIFLFVVLYGILVAIVHATGLPSNYLGQRIMAWGMGALSPVAVIFYFALKKKTTARLLAAASVVLGLLGAFVV